MDNATRKDLLYKARAAGYPGSILDVFAAYDQGRDLISEFQQQQKQQQLQQMSNVAAQNSGLEQPQQTQAQIPQPSIPQPNIPPQSNIPNFKVPQQPTPVDIQSQNSPMGIVSGQTGPNQARAIFAKGGFTPGPGCPEGYFKNNEGKCVEILPQSNSRDKAYINKITEDYCKEFPGAEGCFKNRSEALQNKELSGYALKNIKEAFENFNPESQYARNDAYSGLKSLKTLEQKPLTVKEFDAITNGYGTKLLTEEVGNETSAKILEMLDKEEYIKNLYSTYNKNKLTKITDPVTGKLLPTNDPRAQSSLRETFPGFGKSKKDLGYPELNDEYNMFGSADFPKTGNNLGAVGLMDEKYIRNSEGKYKVNPNYKGKLSEEGKKWIKTATTKYGMDPAVIGYYANSSLTTPNLEKKSLAELDPSLLVESDRYSKQPIISVGEMGEQLTWAPRQGEVTSVKNVADFEGKPRVFGTNMSGVELKKKKKKLGGPICYTCVGRKRRV